MMNKTRAIGKEAILLFIIGLCFQDSIFAQEEISMQDKLIGSTFKILVKAYIATIDIDKLKKENIERINRMSEEKFKKRYDKAYEVIKDLPLELKVRYGITERMTKEQVIKNIKSLDKKKSYEMIDSIPNTTIANQFKQYLAKKKQEIQKSSIVEQINKFFSKIIKKG